MTQNREVKCENHTGMKAVTNREVINAQGFKASSSCYCKCAILAEWNNLLINTIQGGRNIPSPLMLSELGKALA